ncbi:MAG: PIN domain nuclease [Nitrospira bacterium HGW-Nitrospira-1]|nr:MAG: PIN domain nuclease [Nitrospira bacterium HGW-Nitrospira-1]
MADKFLIDSTIWVKYLRGLDAALKDKISFLILNESAYTSAVIIMEILRGAKSDKDYTMLYNDFLALRQLEINHEVWETAWRLAYKLRKKGANVPLTDALISALSLHYKCILLHSDKHFRLIAEHSDLKTLEM